MINMKIRSILLLMIVVGLVVALVMERQGRDVSEANLSEVDDLSVENCLPEVMNEVVYEGRVVAGRRFSIVNRQGDEASIADFDGIDSSGRVVAEFNNVGWYAMSADGKRVLFDGVFSNSCLQAKDVFGIYNFENGELMELVAFEPLLGDYAFSPVYAWSSLGNFAVIGQLDNNPENRFYKVSIIDLATGDLFEEVEIRQGYLMAPCENFCQSQSLKFDEISSLLTIDLYPENFIDMDEYLLVPTRYDLNGNLK
jgi:hypothetical protein